MTICKQTLIYGLLCLWIITACQKSDLADAEDTMNIVFSEDDKPVRGKVELNSNQDLCGKITITTVVKENATNYAALTVDILTNGEIASVKLDSRRPSNSGIYYAPNMEAGKYFTVENFRYDAISKDLSFDFEGRVFMDSLTSKKISGRVLVNSVETKPCSAYLFDARTVSENFRFSSINSNIIRHVSGPSAPPKYENVRYHTQSTTGQLLSLQLEKDLSELLHKEVDFTTEDQNYRVVYAEYHGPMILDGSYNSITEHWKYYQTRGKLQVTGQAISTEPNQKKLYHGIITMDLLDNQQVIQQGIKIPFSGL